MPDPLETLLRRSSASDDVRAYAWDAFHASANPDEFAASLQGLSLPNDVKADLWDLKAGHSVASLRPSKPVAAEDFMTPEQIRNADASARGWPATLWEVAKGGLKGVGRSAVGVAKMAADAGLVPGVYGGTLAPAMEHPAFRMAEEALTPTNMPQRVGALAETAVETAVPAAKVLAAAPAAVKALPEVLSKAAPAARAVARHGFVGAARKSAMKALSETLERMATKSANAGGRLVKSETPTVESAVADALEELRTPAQPSRVTTPPARDLPPGYQPRSSAPKPRLVASRPAPESPAAAAEVVEAAPRKRAYFLKSPEEMAPRAPVEPVEASDFTDVRNLPESWRVRTDHPVTGVTNADVEELTSGLADAGLSPAEAIKAVMSDRTLTPPMRIRLLTALGEAARGGR